MFEARDQKPEIELILIFRQEIYPVWDGNVTQSQNDKKLVLLLDMICDWAINIYRCRIMKDLATMVKNYELTNDPSLHDILQSPQSQKCLHSPQNPNMSAKRKNVAKKGGKEGLWNPRGPIIFKEDTDGAKKGPKTRRPKKNAK